MRRPSRPVPAGGPVPATRPRLDHDASAAKLTRVPQSDPQTHEANGTEQCLRLAPAIAAIAERAPA